MNATNDARGNERSVHETLKFFFGEKWLSKQLDKVQLDGYNDTSPMTLQKMHWHPIIRAIVGTQIKLSRTPKNGTLVLEKDELIQEHLHINLTTVESKVDLHDVQRRLRDETEFPKVEYEIAIAAGYVRTGCEVEFIPTSNTRTGEFYVVDPSGTKVLVECKKKDKGTAVERKISKWWDEFQHLVMKKAKASKMEYALRVNLPLDPIRQETHQVAAAVIKYLESGQVGHAEILAGKYSVDFQKDVSSEAARTFESESDLGVGRSMINTKTGERSETFQLNGRFPSDFIDERIEGIAVTLRHAYGQLEADKPNIVYIDINVAAMTPWRAAEVMRKIPEKISEMLTGRNSKISAVVITDVKPLSVSGAMGLHADEVVIYNKSATHPIPDGFKIYGDSKNGASILEDLETALKH